MQLRRCDMESSGRCAPAKRSSSHVDREFIVKYLEAAMNTLDCGEVARIGSINDSLQSSGSRDNSWTPEALVSDWSAGDQAAWPST